MSTKIEIPQFPELEFEEQKHIYTLRGMELPSVTKIMQPLSSFIYPDYEEPEAYQRTPKSSHEECD